MKRAAFSVLVFGLLLLPAFTIPVNGTAESQGEPVVILNGTIRPVAGAPLERGSILIENGKIAEIGPSVRTPKNARVIDAAGMYVYPGMIAPLTALGLTGYPGVGSDINEIGLSAPFLDPYDALNPEDETIAVARVDGITTVLTAAGSARPINGKAVALRLDGNLPEEMILQRDVCLVFNTSARQNASYPTTYEGLSRFFDEKLRKAKQYMEKKKGGDIPFDPEAEALSPVLEGRLPVVFIAQGEVPIRLALRLMADYKIKGILFSASTDVLKYTDQIAARNIPVIWGGTTGLPKRWEPVDKNYRTAAVLAEKKILFAFSESSSQGGSNVRRQPVPASLSVAYGLAEEEAVKALTINPARMFGLDDRVGTLEVGKSADIVVCTRPIIQASSKIKAVLIAGRIIPLENMQTRLRDKYRAIVRERSARKK
ncbi:MAG: amidohydrolase family protein [Candidatus Aminicenantes bacterium]|nr:amidohydrolase family protein [Candidatus Aminicenantes bacterium]